MAKKKPATPAAKPAAKKKAAHPKQGGRPTRGADAPKQPEAAPEPLAYIVADLRPLAVPIETINPDPRNARAHDDNNLRAISASLRQYGQRRPVVVNRNGNTIEAGHGLVTAAKAIGWAHVAVVWVEDDDAAHAGYSLADNRTAELAAWDEAMLAELVADYGDANADLYDSLLLADLLADGDAAADDSPKQQVRVPEAWQVVVECENEDQQRELYERLAGEGFDCRIVNL